MTDDLDYIKQEGAQTTLSGVQMVKRYGPDPDKWPQGHWRNLLDRAAQALAPPPPPPPPPTTGARYFAADSVWNIPIPSNPSVAFPVGSSQAMALFNISVGIGIAQGSWTGVNYYIASGSNPPLRSWKWADGTWKVDNVPTPPDLFADPNSENYLSVIWPDKGLVWNIADAIKDSSSPSGWRCQSAAPRRLNGSGVWDGSIGPWNGRASGAAYLAGLILKDDIAYAKANGFFPHALCWALPKNAHTATPVSPFTTADGIGYGSGVAPYGSHWQLDPNWDISNFTTGQQWILRTLQRFGAYDVDSTNSNAGCTIYCENNKFTQTPSFNPYPSEWSQGMPRSILQHMRILTPPPRPVYDDRNTFGNPHK